MKTFELSGTLRKETGKKATKQVRKENAVPCVVYGGKENMSFQVTNSDIRGLIYTPNVYIVDLKVENRKMKAILKEMQFHPVKDTLLHVDFLEISEKKPVVIEIPVKLEGLAAGVRAGGKLSLETRKLKVKGIYTNLPDILTINVENLEMGKTIQVKDLSFDGIEILNASNAVVAAVRQTRAARGAAAQAEAAN